MKIGTCTRFEMFLLLSILFFDFNSCTSVLFSKYERDTRFDNDPGNRCTTGENDILGRNISNPMACAKFVYKRQDYKRRDCYGFYYQADGQYCMGCYRFNIKQKISFLRNSVYFARFYGTCPQGWYVDRNSCYFLASDKKNWTDALVACREMGAYLVEVTDPITDYYLKSKMAENPDIHVEHWIGLKHEGSKGFVWITSGNRGWYRSWNPGEPSYAWPMPVSEECVAYNGKLGGNHWQDRACEEERHYICERSVVVD